MIYYFKKEILVRKEHFGSLILMLDGRRYVVDNKYFEILKNIHGKSPDQTARITGTKVKEFQVLLDDLRQKDVINIKKTNYTPKMVENRFISNDCLSFPRTVYWECTQQCNYRCIHCYSESGGRINAPKLPWSAVKKFIDELSEHGVEFLCIGGGEPLMYKNIYKVLDYCRKQKVMVEMTTNASLLDQRAVKKLKAAGLKFIQISIDGASKETYEKIRRNGNFEKMLQNIKNLSQYFTVSICTVVTKLNIKEINDLITLSKSIGAKHYRVLPLMDVGRARSKNNLQITKKQLSELNKHLSYLKKKERRIHIQLNENLILPTRKNISWMPLEHYGCSAGRSTCGIDAYGKVYTCSYLRDKKLIAGELKKKSLQQIWAESPVMELVRTISKLELKCMKCSYLENCRGGCRAAAYLKTGRLNATDPFCTIEV